MTSTKIVFFCSMLCLGAGLAAQDQIQIPPSELISQSVTAIGYKVGGGSTKVDLKGTSLMAQAAGEVKVEAKQGATSLDVSISGVPQVPSSLGAEFLTYVLWVVTPDGRTSNTGEILIDKNGNGKLSATTPAQTFALIVTAEPYFAVRVPSEMVVLQNDPRKNTKGQIFPVNDFKLMKSAQYEKLGNPLALTPDLARVPLQMYEARNAVDIARSRGADKDAPEIFAKATASLQSAERALSSNANKKEIISLARQTIQFAEDARALAAQRQEQARIEAERQAAAAKAAAEAKAAADAQAAAEARRQAELTAAKQAQMRAEAQAKEAALRAQEEAARAEAERARKAAADLRAQLLAQFNSILETRDTSRGLVVNLGDVLFATGKYDLKPDAQLKLAKLSGIILAHPGLNLAVEGYTDNVGGEAFNQDLSEKRADTVRDFLIQQGLPSDRVTAQGFGMSSPVASNDTAAGRQQNRRVEIVVSGDIIGQKIGS
jgi:outer membrane protein OmpA-like peptidoglycan-associated protein